MGTQTVAAQECGGPGPSAAGGMMARDTERRRASFRRWYALNRPRALEAQRLWRESLNGKRHRFKRTLKKYGISAEDWARAWVTQYGKCAGCLMPLDDGQNTHIDHCHQTGAFRGLLCPQCNQAIGKTKHSPQRLRRLAKYVEAHQQLKLIGSA